MNHKLAEETGVTTEMTDRARLIERYRSGMADLQDALADITESELDRPQSSGEWTARQVVHHLADGEAMSYTRLRRLVADDDPVIQGYDEPTFARRLHYDRPIESSLAVVAAVRASSLDLMAAMTPTDWAKSGTHSDIGPYTVDRWLEIYADHVHDHADQIRRARRGEA
ncbi:MAG TPA: DinB family protein [Candidatus Limnocylindrales bacterium]|nr:DinB family protein [Candidatus Limnocylindrales bacterium]